MIGVKTGVVKNLPDNVKMAWVLIVESVPVDIQTLAFMI